jgi:diphthamide biosynthesis protein 3
MTPQIIFQHGVTLSFRNRSLFYGQATVNMAENIYDEVEIEDMEYDPTLQIYHYPCPCGDRFEIGIADLRDGEEIAVCPSCSLMIKVIFEVVSKNLGLAI